MNQKEIVDKLEEILACVSCSEYTYNYGEIMVAAYNLWGFLYYDMGCEYPSHEPVKEGAFDF